MKDPIASPLVRAALIVPNVESAAAFYEDVFGFTVTYYEGSLTGKAVSSVIGAPMGTALKCKIVRGDGPNFGMVGLFEMQPDNSVPVKNQGGLKVGEVCLVFYCSDVGDVMKRALSLGARPVCVPTLFEMPHESQLEASFRDPNGVFINIIERDPARVFDNQPVKS